MRERAWAERIDDRVAASLLTRFLGAGKTTLLDHLMRDTQAGPIALIMDGFGDVKLERDLIGKVTEKNANSAGLSVLIDPR